MAVSNTVVLILAGGLGTRMSSDLPKVLHKVDGKPMLVKVFEQSLMLNPVAVLIVVGKFEAVVRETLLLHLSADIMAKVVFISQVPALGTGHAVQQAVPILQAFPGTQTVIVSGDTPLITALTLHTLREVPTACRLLATKFDPPFGYGRVCLDDFGAFVKIVEQKDCSLEQQGILLCNSGIYMFDTNLLCKHISKLTNQNNQSEFYLTDLPEIIKRCEPAATVDVTILPAERQAELLGVNTEAQLIELNARVVAR